MPRPLTQDEWDTWYDKIYGYFFRRVNNQFDVEELTAVTLNNFCLTEKVLENESAYIFGIAKYKLLDYIRQKYKKPAMHSIEDVDSIEDMVDDYNPSYSDRLEKLKQCMQETLKGDDMQIVELCVMYDFSGPKVAEKMNLSAVNVRAKLSRSIKKLKLNCRQVWEEALI